MVLSMTGFASRKVGKYLIEIQTINKKGAEISVTVPRELSAKEGHFRKKMAGLVQRGHAFVKVFSERGSGEDVQDYQKAHAHLVKLAKALDPSYQVSFETVLNYKFTLPEEDMDWDQSLDELWRDVTRMREEEGKALAKDVLQRCEEILKAVEGIVRANHDAPEIYKKKILEKLQGLVGDEERVLREVILYAEKVDINEEVVRMRSHVSQMRKLLTESKEPIGRTIDFLVQEMMREANTMGSKVPSIEAINGVIFLKGCIEKIRQQGSNIE